MAGGAVPGERAGHVASSWARRSACFGAPMFPSAVEAVQAAVEIQKSLEGHNIELEPERRMQFRIGINLGDLIEEVDGTIYGDGVNIAARMEALAEGGGICISSTVYDAVGKLSYGFDFLGEQQVKNIAKPVRVTSGLPE